MARLTAERALVFIGFMGAGKSTALAASREAGLTTTEVDGLIERELGAPIGEFFEREGEDEFRRREAGVVVPLLEQADGGAIALGGGSVLAEGIAEALQRHLVVWLQIDVEEAWRRVEGSDRPLARDRTAFEALMPVRQPLYERLAGAVLPSGDSGLAGRAMPALLAMLRELPPDVRMVWAASASGEYPIFAGEGLLEAGYWPLEGRRYCVTDTTVAGLYGSWLDPLAGQVVVEPGERAKTLAEAERVLRELAGLGMTRSDHLAALGGGVVGDLGGFCAATYQRGVPVVQVPTTLVAQVDSAIGGKTGVDLPEAKNYIGAYHLPAAVLADTSTLRTLPDEELAAGWAEVIKTGLLAGGGLWERVRNAGGPDPAKLAGIVFDCARFKAEVVAADERDSGRRAILNLGHTVGHAIEAATGYGRYRHGEAVGLGLLAALRLSGADELRTEVSTLLEGAGLPVRIESGVEPQPVAEALERDKKRDAEGVRFVLLSEPGEPHEGQLVEPDRVR
ncbi:MAG: 3-dehydroquinate synthase, partial [Solirubrobacterales bacterium]